MAVSGNRVTVVRAGAVMGEFELKAPMVIGRTPQADIQLEDPQMSRVHATISKEGARFFLSDTSTNGVILSGVKLAKNVPMEVFDGSVAELAGFELHFLIASDGVPETQQLVPPIEETMSKISRAPAAAALPVQDESALEKSPVWTQGDAWLTVSDIIEETDDVKTFRMVGEMGMLFSYKPGQFATLSVDIDGKEVKRSYSISSSPSRPHTLEMTIKRVPGGLVSNWMNDNVKLGDKLRIKGPSGKFSCFNYPSQKILFIAAGSGCTPIMSMSRWIVDTAADVDVVMLISSRTPSDIIYRKELELLAARHSGFKVHLTITSGWRSTEGWTGYTGRISDAMVRMVAPDFLERHVFMCGPKPFGDSTKEILKGMGFPLANLHTESFGSGRVAKGVKKDAADVPQHSQAHARAELPSVTGTAPPSAPGAVPVTPATVESMAAAPPARGPKVHPATVAPATAEKFKVEFAGSGIVVETDGQSPLLDLAETNGVDIDYACRAGSCLSCQVKCRSGEVEMSEGAALGDDEREEGYILACCSTPRSDVVVEA